MFDVGLSELVVIAVVALVVIGPERLPKVARTVGHLLGRLQRYVNDVKADINREMQLDELKKLQEQMTEDVKGIEATVTRELQQVESSVGQSIAPPPAEATATEPVAAAPAATDAAPAAHSTSAVPLVAAGNDPAKP